MPDDEVERVIAAMKAAARDWPEDEEPRYCPECGEPLPAPKDDDG
jgi:hypothetical protein